MSHAQALIWTAVGAAVALAMFAGWREHARKRRRDLDAVGLVAWPTVQMLALIATALGAFAAAHVQ